MASSRHSCSTVKPGLDPSRGKKELSRSTTAWKYEEMIRSMRARRRLGSCATLRNKGADRFDSIYFYHSRRYRKPLRARSYEVWDLRVEICVCCAWGARTSCGEEDHCLTCYDMAVPRHDTLSLLATRNNWKLFSACKVLAAGCGGAGSPSVKRTPSSRRCRGARHHRHSSSTTATSEASNQTSVL